MLDLAWVALLAHSFDLLARCDDRHAPVSMQRFHTAVSITLYRQTEHIEPLPLLVSMKQLKMVLAAFMMAASVATSHALVLSKPTNTTTKTDIRPDRTNDSKSCFDSIENFKPLNAQPKHEEPDLTVIPPSYIESVERQVVAEWTRLVLGAVPLRRIAKYGRSLAVLSVIRALVRVVPSITRVTTVKLKRRLARAIFKRRQRIAAFVLKHSVLSRRKRTVKGRIADEILRRWNHIFDFIWKNYFQASTN